MVETIVILTTVCGIQTALMRERIVLILALAGLAAGCGGGDEAGSTTRIVAAFYPLAFVAEQLAPEADVTNVTPAGAEPHDLELSARDIESIDDADHVLFVGGGFQPALEEAVEGRDGAVDLLDAVSVIDAEDGPDPHVWLDPVRLGAMAREAAGALGEPAAADALVADLEGSTASFKPGSLTATGASSSRVTPRSAISPTPTT